MPCQFKLAQSHYMLSLFFASYETFLGYFCTPNQFLPHLGMGLCHRSLSRFEFQMDTNHRLSPEEYKSGFFPFVLDRRNLLNILTNLPRPPIRSLLSRVLSLIRTEKQAILWVIVFVMAYIFDVHTPNPPNK